MYLLDRHSAALSQLLRIVHRAVIGLLKDEMDEVSLYFSST